MRGKNNSYKSNNTNNNNGNQFEVYVNSVVRQKNNNDNLWMGKLIRENTRCECLHNIDSIRPVNCVALDPAKLILIFVSLCCCCCQRWLSCFQISYSFFISSWTGFFFLLNKWKGCPGIGVDLIVEFAWHVKWENTNSTHEKWTPNEKIRKGTR